MNKRYALYEITKDLVAVAMGNQPADMVIKNGRLINVHTAEIMDHMDVAIVKGRIALVGDASHCIGENTQIIDATGLYIAPGFMDGHIHVESSMLTVKEYAKTVIPHGTTSIFMDPHEIANVLGMDGVKVMIEDGASIPLRVYTTMPSCVPAAYGFEDTGAILSPEEVSAGLDWDSIIGLGEMMNFPGVLGCDDGIHKELVATLKNNKTITGHYSMPETGKGLNAYISSGAHCCHESVRKEDALEKMRLGMYVQMREGSAWHDVKETVRSITEQKIDTRFATLVSDDSHTDTLLEGHLNHIVKRAIEEGVNPITAIQMVTINVADCFQLNRDLGSIAPSKWADIVLLSDLTNVTVNEVIINGELVAKEGTILAPIEKTIYPDFVNNSMHIGKTLTASDFELAAPAGSETVTVRVIEAIGAKVGTYSKTAVLPVVDGKVHSDLENDILKVAVVERHKATGMIGKGFVNAFGIKKGAVASTVAHDAHNLTIVGTNDEDMALAANTLATVGGGMVAVCDGKVLALNPLPIAGLMSNDDAPVVAKRVEALDAAWKELGCTLVSPFMTMALLGLAVLPELRITNRGIVDTVQFKIVDVFVG